MTTETTAADTTTPAATTDSTDTAVSTSTDATAQTTGESQGESETAATEANAEASANEAASVPDAYEFKLPEGLVLEGPRAEATTALFKELKLDQEGAQKLVDFFVGIRGEGEGEINAIVEAKLADAIEAKQAERRDAWAAETVAKFGDKPNPDMREAVKAFMTPELEEALETEGWGNHPALVGFFAQVGKLVRESAPRGLGGSTAAVTADLPLEHRMYPGMTKST